MPVRFTKELLDSSSGQPPLGCRYCDRGAKMVLYITGICRQECYYCPLSEEKKGKDVIFANERRISGPEWLYQVIDEARRMNALGTGITGGDPMVVPERTEQVVRKLKEVFGRKHHIHLYTTGPFDDSLLARIRDAGLDEIRFHPPIETWSLFRYLGEGSKKGDPGQALTYHALMEKAVESGLSTGLEIPAVIDEKGKGTENGRGLSILVDYGIRMGFDFININELEASHTNMEEFAEKGFELVGDSMAVRGSRELAGKVMRDMRKVRPGSGTVLHFCSSVYKDSIQLRHRLKRMARNIKAPYDIMTEDGTFLRGVIITEDPDGLRRRLEDQHGVPGELIEVQDGRLLVASWVLEELRPDIREEAYISEVYPTWDGLEVERIPL